MIELEHDTPYRSVGISCDEDLIAALDDLAAMMAEDGDVPSRSEIARSLLWSAIALVKNPNPRAAELLALLRQDAETAA